MRRTSLLVSLASAFIMLLMAGGCARSNPNNVSIGSIRGNLTPEVRGTSETSYDIDNNMRSSATFSSGKPPMTSDASSCLISPAHSVPIRSCQLAAIPSKGLFCSVKTATMASPMSRVACVLHDSLPRDR